MTRVIAIKKKFRFDRNELSGAFGDIGTDLPLIIGVILASGIDACSVLVVFGMMQISTALIYGMPMPAQPLKAVAALVIGQHISGDIIFGSGIAIGIVMLLLTLSGLLDWLWRIIPKAAIRGVQFGLGLILALTSVKEYVLSDHTAAGYLLAGAAFLITLLLLGNRKFPPAILVILLGIIYALIFHFNASNPWLSYIEIHLPQFHLPNTQSILTGFLLLSLPQIPLSLGNSIFATKQMAEDLFPEKKISIKKIGLTYSMMNLISPFFSGIPTCHGSGGMMGHYTFGARTGGSVLIYGSFYLILGLFFSAHFQSIVNIFPLQVLGIILFFEALGMMLLIRDMVGIKRDFIIVLLVGLMAATIPYGFLIGLIFGTIIYYVSDKIKLMQ